MYRFVGKKGQYYKIDHEKLIMKLNYRCPKGKFVPDSFSCGNTPEEAKKNYESLHPEKGTKKVSKSQTQKEVKSVSSSIQKTIDKVKSGGKITKKEYDILKPLVEKSKLSEQKQKSDSIINKFFSGDKLKITRDEWEDPVLKNYLKLASENNTDIFAEMNSIDSNEWKTKGYIYKLVDRKLDSISGVDNAIIELEKLKDSSNPSISNNIQKVLDFVKDRKLIIDHFINPENPLPNRKKISIEPEKEEPVIIDDDNDQDLVRDKKTGWPKSDNYSKDLPTRQSLVDAASPLKDNKDVVDILKKYAVETSENMNKIAAGVQKGSTKSLNNIKILQQALDSVETPKDMTVFRGIRTSEFNRLKGLGLGKPGTTYTSKSFLSTSVNKDVGAYGDDNNLSIEIKLPAGAHAAYIDSITKSAYNSASDEDIGDEEVMINRNTKFKSHGIRETNSGSVLVLEALIPKKKLSSTKETKQSKQKQNMTIDNDIVTPNKLDKEAEDILGSLENDVMKILKKTKYFDKVPEE